MLIHAGMVIDRYGFYLSGKWDPGQLEGGLAPVLVLIGAVLVAYGAIEWWLRR